MASRAPRRPDTESGLSDNGTDTCLGGSGQCWSRPLPGKDSRPPYLGNVASRLADSLAASYNLGAQMERPPPCTLHPTLLLYLVEEVVEPGSQDVDIGIGGAMFHLLGDECQAFVMPFEGQETGHAEGRGQR